MKEVAVYICSFCKESFDSADAIACHILNNHDCNLSVKKLRKQLTTQNSKHIKLKPIQVKKQKKPSSGEPKIKKYGTEFNCDMCTYKTVYRTTYERHLLKHEKGGRQHKCMYCSYAAVQPHNLKVHLKSVHPFGAVEPVICERP